MSEELIKIEKNPALNKNLEIQKKVLTTPPPKQWLKTHPLVKGLQYIPIGRTEYLLDTLFIEWKVEILREGQLFNSVYVTVRLHYLNPVTGEWSFHDGVGSQSIQTDKGASPSDLGAIKNNAVMLALPSAKSYAIKDAADHLGDIFGRNLNRADEYKHTSIRTTPEDQLQELKDLHLEKSERLSEEDLIELERIIKDKVENSYRKWITHLEKL